jgi:hypothetical protein
MRTSGSMSTPSSSVASANRRRAPSVSRGPSPALESRTFSSTVIGRTRAKCWVTIPIPAAMASRGLAIDTGAPPTSMRPASGVVRP